MVPGTTLKFFKTSYIIYKHIHSKYIHPGPYTNALSKTKGKSYFTVFISIGCHILPPQTHNSIVFCLILPDRGKAYSITNRLNIYIYGPHCFLALLPHKLQPKVHTFLKSLYIHTLFDHCVDNCIH